MSEKDHVCPPGNLVAPELMPNGLFAVLVTFHYRRQEIAYTAGRDSAPMQGIPLYVHAPTLGGQMIQGIASGLDGIGLDRLKLNCFVVARLPSWQT